MKRKKRPGPSYKDHEPIVNSDQETKTNSKGKLGRRGFLKIGAGATAAALANPMESIAQRRTTAGLQATTTGECNDVPFTEPTKVYACMSDGKSDLKYELNAEKLNWAYVCPGNPPTTNAGIQPVFNGALPGPSLYVDRGATINLTLNNKLNGFPPFKKDNCPEGHHGEPDKPACFHHTNLHFHGFQVSPSSLDTSTNKPRKPGPYAINGTNPPLKSSDDVLLDVYPGFSNEYRVVLPDMHAPGTNWYHSHMHGASAFQISGGMAGAIIIREPTEKARIVREDLDKVFLLQEILVNPIPTTANPWPDFPPIYGSQPVGGGKFTASQIFVNGLCRPTLKMKQGQMMRWRFINAGVTPKALMTLRLVKSMTCDGKFPTSVPKGELMHLMAIDGLSFYGLNPQPVRYHVMGLGNRADFLVKFDQPGVYMLLKDGYPLESVTKPNSTTYTLASSFSKQVLMYIDVEASSDYKDEIPHAIPGDRPAYLNPIVTVDHKRAKPVKFQNMSKAKFQIDDAFYGPNQQPIEVQLNTAEEWTLQNWADYKGGAPDGVGQSNTHPFHVHLNPFQIVGVPFDFEVDAADLPAGVAKMKEDNPANWPFWDTVPLPGANKPDPSKPSGELKIWSRFLIYDGEYVTHCHILVHEDTGMMINVKLIGDGKGPGEAVHDYPDAARKCIERTSKPPST
jgi:FtsP/CotA-like multicopper oxidase with cupredoxin domain